MEPSARSVSSFWSTCLTQGYDFRRSTDARRADALEASNHWGATALGMHPRTLRRRLDADGTTFKVLLSEVRRRLAIEYLCGTKMTTEEIARRLGYSDAANSRHAFTRWTAKAPQEYRKI